MEIKLKNKVAILYVCTGTYTVFWDKFYKTFEKNFLRKSDKDYFVFTDGNISYSDRDNVHKVYQKRLGWPYDTLMRFKMFEGVADQLKNFDYIFFFNANMECVTEIKEEEFLPNESRGEKLVMAVHPGYYNLKLKYCPFERRKSSTAYLPYRKGEHYVIGALNGGAAAEYLELIHALNHNTNTDLDNKIIALVHDESHLNAYIAGRKDVKFLSPAFCSPENLKIPFETRILMTDKSKYFNVGKMKNWEKDTLAKRIVRRGIKFIRCNVGWLLDR